MFTIKLSGVLMDVFDLSLCYKSTTIFIMIIIIIIIITLMEPSLNLMCNLICPFGSSVRGFRQRAAYWGSVLVRQFAASECTLISALTAL